VLSPENRLRHRGDFSEVVRRGRRASRPLLTLHLLATSTPAVPAPGTHVRAGLVVSKAVGGSVVRSRVSRQIRHQLRELLPAVPPGSRLVVRAAPAAATATSDHIGADLRAALAKLTRIPS